MKKNNYSFLIMLIVSVGLVAGLIYLVSQGGSDWRIQYASELGLDVSKFEADLSSGSVIARVEDDIKEAEVRGLSSTPSVFVNGEQVVFQVDFVSELSAVVDGLLEQEEVVLIEEFSDLQCPACLSFHDTTATLQSEYAKNENITWTFKHFPLSSIHPYAYDAAIAVEAAREQDKFTEMQDLLFLNQAAFKSPNFN